MARTPLRRQQGQYPRQEIPSAPVGALFLKSCPRCQGDLTRGRDAASEGGCGYLSCLQCGLRKYYGKLIQKKMVGGQPMPGGRKVEQEVSRHLEVRHDGDSETA